MSLQELPESKQEMVITIVQEGQAAMGKAEGDELKSTSKSSIRIRFGDFEGTAIRS